MKKIFMGITIAAVLMFSYASVKLASNEQTLGDYEVAGVVRGA
ncbi:lysogeny pheromone AimP family peptide [Bacillus atrophaeus]|uniref:Uncharacterized protein n=1 Tax=Bacillus atrophaeus (strain 1942) TaxID=720555 RepID=A0ABM5LXY2_BACA1|nr:lysogeny pheromone AimP family peptide [Bacillus atrophaeus]ADP32481.1 hypothetical protein BATR1942_07710 [Bacillus atrophaeus 1942]AIK47403.1 hypothetical protein DJ95_1440 [Bacillus atrophaeus subsp. globigii]EIM11720.1 hypothetical protein UY9_05657 [Bacillus atrophaeus C89]KFK83756.1 hypothetical protein DK44_2195 [Bacillus atrophaeus]KYD05327.1 hypothetical protein B4144_1935 [Bacillus atrophaeus]